MLVGVIAANVLRVMDPSQSRAVGVLFVGYFFQGIGLFMTMFYICIYILRCVSGFARILAIYVKKVSLGQDHDGTSAQPLRVLANERAELAALSDWFHGRSPSEWRIRCLWSPRLYRPRADQSRITRP